MICDCILKNEMANDLDSDNFGIIFSSILFLYKKRNKNISSYIVRFILCFCLMIKKKLYVGLIIIVKTFFLL